MTDYNYEQSDAEQAEYRARSKRNRIDRMMAAIGTDDMLIRRLLETIDAEYRREF